VRFAFRFAHAYRIAARPFGVKPENSWVEVTDTTFTARYGQWRLQTPVANIASWAVTGPYNYLKTAGPARLAITDRGLTFASNGDRGLLVCFHTPVPGMEPVGILRHPELTVTVAEPEDLAEQLAQAVSADNQELS
jgi:hypothetical protein